jgi:hypothetical protein
VASPLTLSQMIETGRPAYSEGYLFRYVPGSGFERANTLTRGWGRIWLPISGDPTMNLRWFHEKDCDCQYHKPVVRRLERTEGEEELAA